MQNCTTILEIIDMRQRGISYGLKYKKECPSGYQYTQYCLHFKRFVEKNYGSEAVSMVVERIPGEKVYIDWIGDQPEILMDSITGELKKVHFFVTTVGVSNLVYAEAFEDEKLPNFIAGTVHALESYGALPKYLVPDNLKTAITKHTKDELVINSAYQDLESFYDVVILPPPPRCIFRKELRIRSRGTERHSASN